jgi:hypothetical protein
MGPILGALSRLDWPGLGGQERAEKQNLSYAIEAPASTSNPPLPNRISTHSLPSMHVPANGTTVTVTATI